MIRQYIAERRSWLLLLVVVHLLPPFIASIDVSIPLMPILYMTLLSTMVCIVFLVARYHKETKFIKQLQAWDHTCGPESLKDAGSPFERVVEESMSAQAFHYKSEASGHLLLLEQEKDELTAWIHEVKTPLTAMRLVIDRLTDESAKSKLEYEWLRIHHLLDRQLHQRRIPFMENDLYVESAKLEPILFQEIKDLRSWCMQKRIGFDVSLQAEQVLTDAKWLGFILRQILTNAVKYSDSSDIKVSSYEENAHVIVEIRDEGRGISSKDLPRIFERGFTSTTMHQDSAATGMGLYLAQKAADALRIRIEADSAYGSGTTFRLLFPVANDFDVMMGM